MAHLNYMKPQQTFLDNAKKKVKERPNRIMAIGADITSYEFTYEPCKTYFKGEVLLRNGKQSEVRFLKAEKTEAEKIFHATKKLEHEAIAILRFITYCESIDSWILCYDRFDYLLGDWAIKEKIQNEMRHGDDLLHFKRSKLIRSLLKAIIYIHTQGLFHTGLHLTSNYVVLSNEVKIINIGMQSLKDLPMPVDDATVNGLRMKDLMGFKDLLKMHILQPGKTWSDRDMFFSFFDLTSIVRYNIFIEKLMEHSFLMRTAAERMYSFFKIDLYIRHLSFDMREEFGSFLEGESFEQYLNWDDKLGDNLRNVYEYEDEKVKRRYYDGKSVLHLLEFLRNAYRHPGKNSMSRLDKDVRTGYSGFLHRIHEALCRLDSLELE